MATHTTHPAGTATRPLSTPRRDLVVALATLWLTGGLYLDGWAHSHVPELETFFTPWHGVLYSGYAALAVALVPGSLWRGRPAGPMRDWVPAGYGLGLLGAALFAVGGVVDMLWHTLLGIEVSLEALLSPPHLLLMTAGLLMITTPVRSAAAKPAPRGAEVAVLLSMLSAVGIAAFFLNYLSPFIDAPSAGHAAPAFGMAEYLTFSVLIVGAALFVYSRLGRVPVGLVTFVVAAAAVPDGVFDDFAHLPAQLWPLLGAVLADVGLRRVAAVAPRVVPVALGAAVPLLVLATHLLGVQLWVGVLWSPELWGGIVVLTSLAGAAFGRPFALQAGSGTVDFSGMVGLVVAALAVLVAGGAVYVALQALRAVQRAAATATALFEAHELAAARADAERVCAWAVSERETFEKIITRGVVGAAVRNAGQSPVYDLEIVFRDPPAAWTAIRRVRLVPPAEQPEVYAGFDEESTDGPVDRDRINADGTIRLAPSADMHVELRFTDARGRRWQRGDTGALTQLGENVARAAAPVESV